MEALWLFWIGFAIALAFWAAQRGRSGIGWFVLALLASPLLAGIFLAVLPNRSAAAQLARAELPRPETHVKCPDCAELVRREARVCRYCGCKLVPQG